MRERIAKIKGLGGHAKYKYRQRSGLNFNEYAYVYETYF